MEKKKKGPSVSELVIYIYGGNTLGLLLHLFRISYEIPGIFFLQGLFFLRAIGSQNK